LFICDAEGGDGKGERVGSMCDIRGDIDPIPDPDWINI
jgi:hypothetical protein